LSPLPVSDFTAALNDRLAAAPPEALADWLGELTGLFARLDALRDQVHGASLVTPPHPGVTLLDVTHAGFDLSRLDALRPRRFSTPVPGLTSVLAQLRRRTFAGETRWLPPLNSGTRSLSTSAWSFLESHSAMYPLRAWLRLLQIGRFGQPALRLLREGFGKGPAQYSFLPALRALREAAALEPIPPIGPLVPTLDSLIGADSMMTLLRRAFAFVAANSNGYADSQWATSPLRTAGATKVDAILGPLPAPRRSPAATPPPTSLTAATPIATGRAPTTAATCPSAGPWTVGATRCSPSRCPSPSARAPTPRWSRGPPCG